MEGDGSFFLRRDSITPTFCIENTGVQLPVLLKIKEFLENSLGFDVYSLYKLNNTSSVDISTIKTRNSTGKSSVALTIKNIYLLNNYIIPFFDDTVFFTKKAKDFNDFKIMCLVVYRGAHRKQEIRSLLLNLSNTMNNFRLSTCKENFNYLSEKASHTQKEVLSGLSIQNKLLLAQGTIKHLVDGRVIDIATEKILPRLNCCIYEIKQLYGDFILANTLSEAASIVELYPETLSKYLDSNLQGGFVDVEIKKQGQGGEAKPFKIRRVRVFSPPFPSSLLNK